MTPDEHAVKYPEVWCRFNPRQTLLRYTWYLAIVCLAVWSISNLDIPWFYFLDAHVQAGDLITRMFPPDWEYADQLLGPLIETIHIATLGTAVTIFIAFPLAFLAARNTTFNPATWFIGRLILVTSRSVNTAVWGLLFVAIFGPGPMAGIWAIAARSIGFMGKLVAEAIEATGASRLQVLHVNFKTQEGFLVSVYWWERLSSRDFHYQLLCLCFW